MGPPLTVLAALVLALPCAVFAQHPPSQLELNGFLIGQHQDAIAGSFASLYQADTTSDGWIDRVYIIDRAHHAYMAFKFAADRRDYAISVQVAGQPGTPMLPFLGLRLGDSAVVVEHKLGRPTQISPEPDLKLQLWDYADRNYSVEIDSTNHVSSIQILGYDGLPDKVPDGLPDPVERLRPAISAIALDSLMAQLAPDIEIYKDSDVVRLKRAARAELSDTSSPVHHLLLAGSGSLRAALAAEPKPTDSAVRVHEHGPVGLVYHFAGPVNELVFVYVPGGWRLWEVRFR